MSVMWLLEVTKVWCDVTTSSHRNVWHDHVTLDMIVNSEICKRYEHDIQVNKIEIVWSDVWV